MARGFDDGSRYVVRIELQINEHLNHQVRDRAGQPMLGQFQLSPQPVDSHTHTMTHINSDVLQGLRDARAELDAYIAAVAPIVAKLPPG